MPLGATFLPNLYVSRHDLSSLDSSNAIIIDAQLSPVDRKSPNRHRKMLRESQGHQRNILFSTLNRAKPSESDCDNGTNHRNSDGVRSHVNPLSKNCLGEHLNLLLKALEKPFSLVYPTALATKVQFEHPHDSNFFAACNRCSVM